MKRNKTITDEQTRAEPFQNSKPAAVSRDSKDTDHWSMSAYQRETPLTPQPGDTIFRGSVAASPVSTLELTIDGIQTRFPAQSGAGGTLPSPSFSRADSDPFSDYRSYESDQGGIENIRDQVENDLMQKKMQPRPRCNTTFPPTYTGQQNEAFPVTDQSPLDTLRRNLRTPTDLPQSPSPFSLRRMHTSSVPLGGPPLTEDRKADSASNSWSVQPSSARAPRSSGLHPIPTSFPEAITPNFSLPAAKNPSTSGATQHSPLPNSRKRGSFLQWYLRSDSVISCTLSTAVAICLTICSLSTNSGASLLATVPAKAFAELEIVADFVELHISAVCLLRKGVSDLQ